MQITLSCHLHYWVSRSQSAAEGKCVSDCQERGPKLKVQDIAFALMSAQQLQGKWYVYTVCA